MPERIPRVSLFAVDRLLLLLPLADTGLLALLLALGVGLGCLAASRLAALAARAFCRDLLADFGLVLAFVGFSRTNGLFGTGTSSDVGQCSGIDVSDFGACGSGEDCLGIRSLVC